MRVATPASVARATKATPTSSPAIIHKVRRTPIVIPRDSANVMQRPGVADTKKNVGKNKTNKLNLINLASRIDRVTLGCHGEDRI